MNSDILNQLRGTPLFCNLSPVYITRLSEKAVSMKFAKGQDILEQGSNCNNLFITATGKMETHKKLNENTEILLDIIGPGGIYGESHLFDGSAVDVTLRAAEPSVIICLDRTTIISLIKENPEFARSYIRQLSSLGRQSEAKERILLQTLVEAQVDLPEPYTLRQPDKPAASGAEAYSDYAGSAAEENTFDTEGEDEVFFRKEYNCPLCKERFATLKPRQKYIIAERTDPDFCVYYKTVNPLYYEINVCPRCGYSFNNSTSEKVRVELSDRLAQLMADNWGQANYCGKRELDDAIETFKLALECQRERGAGDAPMGRLFLKLAWLYRYKKEQQRELGNLEKALYHLTKSYDNLPADPKEEINLMFLLGQLNHQLGSDREAVNWFIRITQHPDKKTYPYMVNRARDAWQSIRNEMKA